MKKVSIDKVRNFALLGHQDTGKTSFLEAVLFASGQTSRLARVSEGNSNLDFTPEEIERRITVKAKLVAVDWKGHRLHCVDTPGYDDFVAERIGAIGAVETALVFVKADADVEPGTQSAWRLLDAQSKPRFVIVNKMDKEHANFDKVVERLQARLSPKIVPLFLPIGAGAGFRGVVSAADGKAYWFEPDGVREGDTPADMQGAVTAAREALMNAAAETSDALVEKFLDTGELTETEFHDGLVRGLENGTVFPVLPAQGNDLRGLGTLLDVLVRFSPSPTEVDPIAGTAPDGSTVTRRAEATQPLAAQAFGALSEANVGDYIFLRVWSGRLAAGMDVLNSSTGEHERIGPLFLLNGKQRLDSEDLSAGEIGAAVKLRNTHVGQTLCDRSHRLLLPTPQIPAPLTFTSIKSRTKGDEDKLAGGLQRLHEEDLGFRVVVHPETHQTLLMTQGDTHAAIILAKLKRKFNVEIDTEPPKTPYRETIKGKADERYRHKKQTGGRGQFGEVHLVLEPRPRGTEFEFVDGVVGGVIPGRFIPAVEKGVREAMSEGVVAGYPVVDLRVTVDDGKHHDVDSSEAAFKIAGAQAFKLAFPKAKPVLLEPIYRVAVRVPEEYMGHVMGDMSSRRGRILGMDQDGHEQLLRAEVPLAQLYDYAMVLRALTQARASHTREFSHYEEVPREIAETIIAGHRAAAQTEA
ncbi:MAG TPA: elongation factor G [Candidatus Krumholzibacteria bacterium]|nr:elongation factor G [Candidatus Krumholzibacteria bacterium]